MKILGRFLLIFHFFFYFTPLSIFEIPLIMTEFFAYDFAGFDVCVNVTVNVR